MTESKTAKPSIPPTALRWIAFAIALVGVYLSNDLLALHSGSKSDQGWLSGNCVDGEKGCSKVASSRWSMIPPGPEISEDTPNAIQARRDAGGIPVAALGLFYWLFLAVYLGVIGSPSWPVRKLHLVLIGVNVLGLIGSLVYLSIMWGVIGETCKFCLFTHLCNFAIAPLIWKLRPVEPKFPEEGGGLVKPVLPFPDVTLGVVCLLLFFSASWAQWNSYQAKIGRSHKDQIVEVQKSLESVNAELASVATLRSDYQELQQRFEALSRKELDLEAMKEQLKRFETIADDMERVDAVFMAQEKQDLGVRDDDPKITPRLGANGRTGRYMQIAIWSDIECPNCARFHDFLKSEVMPLYNGHLEIVHKYYPARDHAHALPMSKALEAARMQGNEKYWELHEYLHNRRNNLGAVDLTEAAIAVGLDVDRFLSEKESPQVLRRIQEDIRQAQKVGVRGTPAVYLNGRPVDRLFRSNIGWWKIRVDILKAARERSKQPW